MARHLFTSESVTERHPDKIADQILDTDLNGMTKLHLAVLNSDSSLAKRLLRQGAKVNCKNRLGQTPLHLAILNGDIDICQLLLAKGAQSNAPDINGDSPIQLAINTGNDELFELLIACSTVG